MQIVNIFKTSNIFCAVLYYINNHFEFQVNTVQQLSFTLKRCCQLDTFLPRCRRTWTPAPPTPTTTRTASPSRPPPPTRTPTGAGGGEQWYTPLYRGPEPGQHRATLSVPPGGCCSSTNIILGCSYVAKREIDDPYRTF